MSKVSLSSLRIFLRGFAVGCITVAVMVMVVNREVHKDRYWPTTTEELSASQWGVNIVDLTFQRLEQVFYRPVTQEDVYRFIDGALRAMDPNSGHVPASGYRALSGQASPEEVAENPYRIGILGSNTDAGFIIDAAAPFSPADVAGIRPGDRLVAVAGQSLEGMPGQQAYDVLSKAVDDNPGTAFSISVIRGLERLDMTVTPSQLEPSYAFDFGQEQGIAHIIISGFYPGMTDQVRHILEVYRSQENLKGVVLDVRSNSGGRVTEVESLASLFMPEGTLIYTSTTRISGIEEFKTKGPSPFFDLPVAVLINNESASASEILAGFFQGQSRGQVVGQTSFGKGTIQSVIPLDAQSGAIRITIGSYKDAAGRAIQEVGVVPDIVVSHEGTLERPPRGLRDEALVLAREWILSGAKAGTIPGSPRPNLRIDDSHL